MTGVVRFSWMAGATLLLGGCVGLDGLAGGDSPPPAPPVVVGDPGLVPPPADDRVPSGSPAAPIPRPVTACSPTAPFTTEETVVSSSGRAWGARVSGPTLFFTRSTQAGSARVVSAPLTDTATFVDVTPPTAGGWLGYPSVTRDGLRMYFHMPKQVNGNAVAGDDDLFVADRSKPSDAWLAPVRLDASRVGYHDATPYISASGATLYFATYTDTKTEAREIRRATMTGNESDGGEVALVGVSSALKPSHPVVSDDEKTMYFSMLDAASGQRGIYMATRDGNGLFSGHTRVAELSKAGRNASPTWVSPDLCVLYFDVNDGERIVRALRSR